MAVNNMNEEVKHSGEDDTVKSIIDKISDNYPEINTGIIYHTLNNLLYNAEVELYDFFRTEQAMNNDVLFDKLFSILVISFIINTDYFFNMITDDNNELFWKLYNSVYTLITTSTDDTIRIIQRIYNTDDHASKLTKLIYKIHFKNIYSFPVEWDQSGIPIVRTIYDINSFISSIDYRVRALISKRRYTNINVPLVPNNVPLVQITQKRKKLVAPRTIFNPPPAANPMIPVFGGRVPIKHAHTRTKRSIHPLIKVSLKRRIQKGHTKKYKKTRSTKYKLNKTIKK